MRHKPVAISSFRSVSNFSTEQSVTPFHWGWQGAVTSMQFYVYSVLLLFSHLLCTHTLLVNWFANSFSNWSVYIFYRTKCSFTIVLRDWPFAVTSNILGSFPPYYLISDLFDIAYGNTCKCFKIPIYLLSILIISYGSIVGVPMTDGKQHWEDDLSKYSRSLRLTHRTALLV